MKRHWNLLSCAHVRSLTPQEQFASYAMAYLDSAQRLCQVLARSPKKATFERGAVVLYLTAHAVELFLKGAILRKSPNESLGHDLEHIQNRYNVLYPAKRFRLTSIPFSKSYEGMSKSEIMACKAKESHAAELYRYPENKEGEPFVELLAFEPNSFMVELSALRENFERVREELDG